MKKIEFAVNLLKNKLTEINNIVEENPERVESIKIWGLEEAIRILEEVNETE